MGSDDRTSSAQFREGDVVLCTPQIVAGVSSGEPFEAVVEYWGGGLNVLIVDHGHWGQRAIKLLRRPVRVGDVLHINSLHETWAARVTGFRGHPDWPLWLERLDNGAKYQWACNPDHMTHADGTPIEPMRKTSGSAEGPVASSDDQPKKTAVTTTTPARGPEEAGTVSRAKYDQVLRERDKAWESLRSEMMRASKAADEAGALLTENRRMTRRCDALELQLRRAGLTPKVTS